MADITNVIGDYKLFYKTLSDQIHKLGIDTSNMYVDHFCYRTSSLESYEEKKKQLLTYSGGFLENYHHGRPVSKFLLKKPLQIDNQKVRLIELPSPKKNVLYKDGLEHFEYVVSKSFNVFKKKYEKLWSGQDNSGQFNQPVYIKFKEGVVKFHEKPLTEVVELEGNTFIKI